MVSGIGIRREHWYCRLVLDKGGGDGDGGKRGCMVMMTVD